MSENNLTPIDEWSDVPQLEITDKVLGGAGQIANAQAQALANRSLNLKNIVESNKTTQDNKNLSIDSAIENLNSNKVNISDIVNNSTTTASPLSLPIHSSSQCSLASVSTTLFKVLLSRMLKTFIW